jgi:ABC-2 type transport system permease protein
VKIVAFCADMQEAKQLLDEKKAYGILLLPSEFSRELHAGRQATVSLYSDLSSMLYYKNFLEAATEVSLSMGKKIAQREHPSATRAEAGIKVNPVPYESVAMYNPQNGFCSFLLPAILMLVIQQTLILGICMLGGTAREKNRFGTLVPVSGRYHGTLRIVFGKSLVYIMLYIVVCGWVLMAVPALFSLPQLASPRTIILFVLPYLFACIFLSMTLSGIMTSRESPMLIFVFSSVILLFLSGVSWPRTAIHGCWQVLATVFPSTPGIQGFVSINTMGASLEDVASSYKLLWLQTGFYFITACLTYRYHILRSRKISQNKYPSNE